LGGASIGDLNAGVPAVVESPSATIVITAVTNRTLLHLLQGPCGDAQIPCIIHHHPVYQFLRNPDGTCCRFILINIDAFANALFPPTASLPRR
jgi:hypothetical protein